MNGDRNPRGWRWLATSGLLTGLALGAWSESAYARAWFLRRAADRAYYGGEFESALAGYERVRRLLPGYSASHTNLADSICEVLEWNPQRFPDRDAYDAMAARAAAAYLDAIRVSPPNAWSYAGLSSLVGTLAGARRRASGVDLASFFADPLQALTPEDYLQETAMLKAVQLEPRNFYYHDFLGQFYWTHGFWDRAQAHVRAAVRLQPVLDRHFYLSNLVDVSPRVLTAVELGVQDALASPRTEVPPEEIHRLLAEVYLRLGELDKARSQLAAAAAFSVNPFLFEIHIGRTYATEGNDEQALRSFSRATELAPEYHRGWLELGLTLSRLGHHAEAVEAFEQARGLAPLEFQPAWHLAVELDRGGELDGAARILDGLIRAHPDKREGYTKLIDVSMRLGSINRATGVARQLVERFPDEPLFEEQLRQLESTGSQ